MILSTSFLVLEILILALSVLIGYRRGIGRTAVRLVYLLVIGTVAFFLAKAIASPLSQIVLLEVLPMVPADVMGMLQYSPELEPLVANIIGALIAPWASPYAK